MEIRLSERPPSPSVTPLDSDPRTEGFLERRIALTGVLIALVWVLLVARMLYLQILQGEAHAISAEHNSVRKQRVQASRGLILDRQGQILVDSRPSYEVQIVPHEIGDMALTLHRLSGVLDVDLVGLTERVGTPRGSERFRPLRVVRGLERDSFARLQARLWALPGVVTQVTPVRAYPYGESAAHALGWLGEISSEQLGRREYHGYRGGDIIGREGIEQLLDRDLRGWPGGRNVLVDARGRELRVLSHVEPEPGRNVVLTIDHRLQEIAEQGLDRLGKTGAVVALDPRSGEILVLASRPAFDPNRFAVGISSDDWAAFTSDEAQASAQPRASGTVPARLDL